MISLVNITEYSYIVHNIHIN